MLTVQDLQVHPAVAETRETAKDFTRRGALAEMSPEILATLGEKYLSMASDHPGDIALMRAVQCLEAASARGVDKARQQLAWIEQSMAAA